MEDKDEYKGTSTELHEKLKAVAEDLGVDVDRDKAWPKSARWLWRRIKEVVPLLVAAGIEAARSEEKRGTVIALRKIPTDDATNATAGRTPQISRIPVATQTPLMPPKRLMPPLMPLRTPLIEREMATVATVALGPGTFRDQCHTTENLERM